MTEPLTPSVVHRAPAGCASSVPCCGVQVFDLPRTDRITIDGEITCGEAAAEHLTDQQTPIVPPRLAAIVDAAAGRAHSPGGSVMRCLAEVLTAHQQDLQAEVTRLRAESERRLGELLFWEFEYRAAMDNYRGEAQHAKKLRAELAQARTALAEPIIAEWTGEISHSNTADANTTIQCFDVDNSLRGIALEINLDNCEVLGSMLLDPPGPLDDDGEEICLCPDHGGFHQNGCPQYSN